MPERTLEERVTQLERRLDELAGGRVRQPQTPTKDWRRTVGMFRGDPIMKEVIDGALSLREEERRVAHDEEAREP